MIALTTEPFSLSTLIGMRVPAVVLGLVAVIVALSRTRRIGAPAALLGALGLFLLLLDNAAVLALLIYEKHGPENFDTYAKVIKVYDAADASLNAVGLLLISLALLAVRRSDAAPASGRPAPLNPMYPPPPPQQYSPPPPPGWSQPPPRQ